MLDWIFEGIATWIASVMTQIMDAISGVFLGALGTDMTAMEEYFPFAVSAYTIIQYAAWALLFLVVVWQIFRAFSGPLAETENPLAVLARGAIFAVLIGYAKPIFTIALDIARAPYTALMDSSIDPGDFTFAGIEQTLTNGITTLVSVATVVGLILLIILMIALAWNYFKLLLETVERYVLVGVLCYTSPLAYAMGASKATSRVFQSWCRMVGSQLLLLVLNVWFLRAFNSSVGQFVANGGALSTGQGNIFLWIFCALALLKIAQKCDSYLAAMGLSVAQTGSSMGVEMLMAARALTGFSKGGGSSSASSVFGGAARGAGASAAGTAAGAAASGGILSGFMNRYKPNSFVRDAVVDGGSRMGAGGSVGFVGRAFGGMAARNGATLTPNSVSSVATRPPNVSGTIGGDIADRSVVGYMPNLAAGAAGNMTYSGTQITGGHISTTATGPDGRQAKVDLYSTAQHDAPSTPHTVVNAADGSQWYQVASGDGMGAFYPTPAFTGDASEAAQVSEAFPTAQEGTLLRQVDEGTMEATYPDGSSALWYNSAFYQEPDAPHETVQGADGLNWYAMTPAAAAPQFEQEGAAIGDANLHDVPGSEIPLGGGIMPGMPSAPGLSGDAGDSVLPQQGGGGEGIPASGSDFGGGIAPMPDTGGVVPGYDGGFAPASGGETSAPWYAPASDSGGHAVTGSSAEYNQALFGQFMPGFDRQVVSVDSSRASDGILEVRHEDGSGTAFYDRTVYQPPKGDYHVFEDNGGGQWYAIQGTPAVERRPLYEEGKPVYNDDGVLQTYNVETVRYKSTPTKYLEPQRRPTNDRKAPNRKKP